MEGFTPCNHLGYNREVWCHEDTGFFHYPLCTVCYKTQLRRIRVTIIKCISIVFPRDLVRLICIKYYSSTIRVYPVFSIWAYKDIYVKCLHVYRFDITDALAFHLYEGFPNLVGIYIECSNSMSYIYYVDLLNFLSKLKLKFLVICGNIDGPLTKEDLFSVMPEGARYVITGLGDGYYAQQGNMIIRSKI